MAGDLGSMLSTRMWKWSPDDVARLGLAEDADKYHWRDAANRN